MNFLIFVLIAQKNIHDQYAKMTKFLYTSACMPQIPLELTLEFGSLVQINIFANKSSTRDLLMNFSRGSQYDIQSWTWAKLIVTVKIGNQKVALKLRIVGNITFDRRDNFSQTCIFICRCSFVLNGPYFSSLVQSELFGAMNETESDLLITCSRPTIGAILTEHRPLEGEFPMRRLSEFVVSVEIDAERIRRRRIFPQTFVFRNRRQRPEHRSRGRNRGRRRRRSRGEIIDAWRIQGTASISRRRSTIVCLQASASRWWWRCWCRRRRIHLSVSSKVSKPFISTSFFPSTLKTFFHRCAKIRANLNYFRTQEVVLSRRKGL